MLESRWGRRLGPWIAALAGILIITSASVGAATAEDRPPPDCAASRAPIARARGIPWFRLDPTMADGRRVGQRLTAGLGSERHWTMPLDPESFATGPRQGRIVIGTDDGSRASVWVLDTRRGCTTTAATSEDVIRSATLGPDGRTLFEHRVSRTDRHDRGVWRRSADGTTQRVLPPPDVDAAFGRTWLTSLHWSGRRLIIESCGEVACRFRELDPASGAVRSLSEPALGSLVGVQGDALIARGACRGLPCPVLRADLATGEVVILADDVGPAVLVGDAQQALVVVSDVDGHGGAALRLDGRRVPLPSGDPRLRLVAPTPELGLELPPGWIPLLGPDGPSARTLDSATPRQLDEVRP